MLPKFRYLDEALRYLDKIKEEVDVNQQLIRQQQEVLSFLKRPNLWTQGRLDRLAANLDIIDITPSRDKPKNRLKKKVDPKLQKIVVPNLKKLESQYSLLDRLYQQHQTLESLETQISMQFSDARDLKNALTEIKQVKAKVESQMKEIFVYLAEVADAHAPSDFKKYVSVINQEISDYVTFLASSQYLYVSVSSKGSIVFTNYTLLEDAVNDEGETANLYVVVQLVGGNYKNEEEPSVKVFLMHEFDMPNILIKDKSGVEVSNAGDAVRTISNLLDIENFSSALGVVPLNLQLKMDPDLLVKDIFSYRDYISRIELDDKNQSIAFVLRKDKGVDENSAKQIMHQLFVELKELLRKSRSAKIRSSLSKQGSRYIITFRLQGIAGKKDFNLYDAEFLKEKFDLSENQLRRIVNILNAT